MTKWIRGIIAILIFIAFLWVLLGCPKYGKPYIKTHSPESSGICIGYNPACYNCHQQEVLKRK